MNAAIEIDDQPNRSVARDDALVPDTDAMQRRDDSIRCTVVDCEEADGYDPVRIKGRQCSMLLEMTLQDRVRSLEPGQTWHVRTRYERGPLTLPRSFLLRNGLVGTRVQLEMGNQIDWLKIRAEPSTSDSVGPIGQRSVVEEPSEERPAKTSLRGAGRRSGRVQRHPTSTGGGTHPSRTSPAMAAYNASSPR